MIKELRELFDQNCFKSGLNDTGVNIIALPLEGTISTVREWEGDNTEDANYSTSAVQLYNFVTTVGR